MKILKFYADWCQPCKMLTPILKDLLEGTNIELEEISIDNNQDMIKKYNIRSIPYMVMLDDSGEQVRNLIGYSPTEDYNRLLKEFIG